MPNSVITLDEPGAPPDPFTSPEDPEPYRRPRLFRLATRVVAAILVIGIVLAFPLAYVLDEQIRNHHVEAVVAITDFVVIVVLVSITWSVRRRPR